MGCKGGSKGQREKKTSKLVGWQALSQSHQMRTNHLNEDNGRRVEKSPRKQEPEVLRLGNKIVPDVRKSQNPEYFFGF